MNYNSASAIDLHIHSTFSDGLSRPREIIEMAVERSLQAVALTDHDEVAGLDEAMEAGKIAGIEVIPGIEVSATLLNYETHILGYLFDPRNEGLGRFTEVFRQSREERAREILHRLHGLGIQIPFEVLKHRAGEGNIGRPHIADILVEEGIVFSFQEAFHKYLGERKPGYVPKMFLTARDAIELIHNAGGLAFLAHPGVGLPNELIFKLMDQGLDGLETIHPRHTESEIIYYKELADKCGLLQTGGSDCHGARRGEIMMGSMNVPYKYLQTMKERLGIASKAPDPAREIPPSKP